jgi:superfamily II DNA or RNA helicase
MSGVSINRWSAHPYYFINGELDARVTRALTREMSYFVQGAERSKKFKEGRWDGKECLLYKTKKGIYFFPVGMLDCVKRIFSDFDIEYFVQDITLEDVRKRYKPLGMTWTGHELRDYQKKAVREIQESGGGTIFLPTGAGKTLVMLRLIYEYNLPCLIIVHTKELLYQWEKNIKACFNGRIPGLIGDGHLQWDPVTVAMVQTLSQKIVKDKMDNIDYPILCVDETHHAPSNTVYMVAMHTNSPCRIGASATPTRVDGAEKKIWAATGEIKTTVSAEELIDSGVLARPSFVFLTPPPMSVGRSAHYADAYTQAIVINEERNNLIIKKAIEFSKRGDTVYVHVSRIDHGEILSERIPGSVFLCGKDNTTKRQGILNKYNKGDIKVLVSTLLGEGCDVPRIDSFIAASGGKSEIGTIQRAGRALRTTDKKKTATIVDFRDSGRWFGDHWQDRYNTYKKTYGDCVPDVGQS